MYTRTVQLTFDMSTCSLNTTGPVRRAPEQGIQPGIKNSSRAGRKAVARNAQSLLEKAWRRWTIHRRQRLKYGGPLSWCQYQSISNRVAKGPPFPFYSKEWDLLCFTFKAFCQRNLIIEIDDSVQVLGDGLIPTLVRPEVMRCCCGIYSIDTESTMLTTGPVVLLRNELSQCVGRRVHDGYVLTVKQYATDLGGNASCALVKLVFPDGQSHGSVEPGYDCSSNGRVERCVAMIYNTDVKDWEANAFITIH